MTTTTMNAFNEESQRVMNYMQGKRNAEQMVWEFFGLRKEAVYNDQWDSAIDFINDFKNEDALKRKKVHLHPILREKGITDEMFNKLFDKVPNYGWVKPTVKSNNSWKRKKAVDWVDGSTEAK